MLNIKKWCNI